MAETTFAKTSAGAAPRVRPAAVGCLLWALAGGSGVGASAITVAWDPSADAAVAGYLVYVGTQSRVYEKTYDVGPALSFSYQDGLVGRRYYFSVAAYTTTRLVGARSDEVSAVVQGETTASVRSFVQEPKPSPDVVCLEPERHDCFDVQVLARVQGPVGPMVVTPDGRLFFVESHRLVRVLNPEGVAQEEPALRLDGESRVVGLALDPAFDRTQAVFVGEAQPLADGRCELTIVRYRELRGSFGQPAGVVPGLPACDAPLAVDDTGRIYVALPADTAPGRATGAAYAGFLLRFADDGSVPRESRAASPILGHSYSRPMALVWDSRERAIWLAGLDARWPHTIGRVTVSDVTHAVWPVIPAGVQDAQEQPRLFMSLASLGGAGAAPSETASLIGVTTSGGVYLRQTARGVESTFWRKLALDADGRVVSIAAGLSGEVYAAKQTANGPAAFSILKLTPVRAGSNRPMLAK